MTFRSSSRKRFVSQDHWLMTSQIDMQSFVEAAVLVAVPSYPFDSN